MFVEKSLTNTTAFHHQPPPKVYAPSVPNDDKMSGPIDCTALVQHMKRHLLVQDLKNVLKSAGLPCSGLKAQLQERLMSREYCVDVARFVC